jgi:hypothetical protein
VIDADVQLDERLRDESLPNQDGALSDRNVSGLDASEISSTFFAICADDSSHQCESEFHRE